MSSDALLLNGANRTLLNGKNLDYSDSSNQESSSMNSSSVEQTYDSLFPALPEGNNFGSSKSISQWSQNFLSPNKSESNSEGHGPKISKIRSSKISENFTIFSEEKRDTAKICAEIAKETDTEIERTTTSEGLAFLITGKIEKVKEAKKRIFAELTTPTIYELEVPKEAYGSILGKSGLRLKELENRSGAKIFMPKIDSNDLIRIKGSKEAIETAVHDIQLISSEALSKCKEVLSIDYEFHAFINGPFNETLQALQNDTGAKINIPPYSFKKNEIIITGDQNAINNAKERILKIYNQIKLNCETIPINIKKCQHKYIVGPKGSVLNDIFKQTGVAIQMPSDPTSEQIILRGEQSKLGLALTILYNKAHSEIILNIEAKSWIQRHLITLYGIRLQTLNENFSNVHVTFSFEEDLIKLSGPKEEVEKANKIILSRIESIESKIKVKEITVDPVYHKFIIGKGGNNIKKIREETGAQIIIPVANSQNANIITIQGNKDSIELADQKLQEIIKKAVEKEAQVSKDLNIEHRFHSQLIGIKGETIKEIRDKFNVFIAFPDSSIKSDKVTIRGEKNDVENCFKHLTALHKKLLAENFRLELLVNKQVYKYIVSLDNLKRIRNETETKIEFPNDDSNQNYIVICGKKENVDKAKNLIKKIEKDELNFVQVDIIIPRKFHDSIIGKKKSIIRAIQEECDNVQITFPQINSNSDKVTIRGSKEGVAKAKKQLVDLSNDKQLNNYQEVLPCKFNFHRFLIGKNGSNINKIKDSYGVRVFFPKEDDAEQINEITIIGKKENVLKAKKELEDKISALEKIVEVTINIPLKYHSQFYNKKRPLVKIISEENNGVIIQFPARDSTVDVDKVTIKGAKEFVETAKIRLLEVVEDLKQQINHEIEIDPKYHGSVMGTRAMNLVELEKKHKVKIFFPKKEINNAEDGNNENKVEVKRSNKISIQGRKENCEKAAQDLFALVPINYEISVPFEFHRNIIGKKGVFLKYIQENFRVSTKMPKQEEESDKIVLIGLENDVLKAKEYIDNKIEELKKQKLDDEARSFNMKVVTQSSFIPKIIGKKGATINELRKNYDVFIQFSDEKQSFKNKQKQVNGDEKLSENSLNTSSDKSEKNDDSINENSNSVTIIVTGYEKNVKNAVKKLNKIIKEIELFTVAKIHIDPENYSKLIGAKGKNIKKLLVQFKVDIKFPNDGSDVVTISGLDKNVEACKEEIEKQFAVDEDSEMSMYLPPSTPTYSEIKIKPGKFVNSNSNNNSKGFFVRDAPWDKKQSNDNQNRPDTNNVEEFPSMNTSNSSSEAKNIVWVPK